MELCWYVGVVPVFQFSRFPWFSLFYFQSLSSRLFRNVGSMRSTQPSEVNWLNPHENLPNGSYWSIHPIRFIQWINCRGSAQSSLAYPWPGLVSRPWRGPANAKIQVMKAPGGHPVFSLLLLLLLFFLLLLLMMMIHFCSMSQGFKEYGWITGCVGHLRDGDCTTYLPYDLRIPNVLGRVGGDAVTEPF